eukprot:2179423-Rhodomonas_salina.1
MPNAQSSRAVAHPKPASLESQTGSRAPCRLRPPSIPISPTQCDPDSITSQLMLLMPAAPGVSLNLEYPSSHWHRLPVLPYSNNRDHRYRWLLSQRVLHRSTRTPSQVHSKPKQSEHSGGSSTGQCDPATCLNGPVSM